MIKKMILLSSAAILSANVAIATAYAGNCELPSQNPANIQATLHTTYMPNLLPVVLNSESKLGLSAEHCKAFNKFKNEKAPGGAKLSKQILSLESQSHDEALRGASWKQLQARNDEIQALRNKLANGKIKCHQFVKSQLNNEQYTKLINEIYPEFLKGMKNKAYK